MMYKSRNGQYVTAGVQGTPSMRMNVRSNVRLPDSEAGASLYGAAQKPFYAETIVERRRMPITVSLNSALVFLCLLFVLFGAMTLSRTVRKAAIAKDISAMEQSIQETQLSNAALALEVAEARDMARIGFAATHKLFMEDAADAETKAVHAPDTRPFGEESAAAVSTMKTGSR